MIENTATQPISLPATLRWLWYFWARMPIRLVILLVLTPISVAFDVYVPLFIRQLIDELGKTHISAALIQEKALFIFLFGIAHLLFYVSVQSLRGATNVGLENDFRVRVFRYMVGLGQSFFQKFKTGDLITRLVDDASENKLGWFACSGIFRLYESLLRIAGCLYFMVQLNVGLTALTAIPLGFVATFYVLSSRRTTAYSLRTQKAISELNSFLTNTFDGIRIVKSYTQESRQEEGFDKVVQNQLTKEIELVKMSSLLELSYSRFSEIIVLLIFAVGGGMVIHNTLTLGMLMAFNSYIFMLIWPMVDIGQFFMKGRGAGVSVQRLQELENFKPDITQPSEPLPIPESALSLEFIQIGYSFPNGYEVLQDVNFVVAPRETVAIAGVVGSGKSTFVNFIPRLMDPHQGKILLNGRNLKAYDVQQLRNTIGFVTQIPSLFSDTIRNNILFGRDGISEASLHKAIQVAQLEQELATFPEGLETLIGQRGVKISGGQKQRIAIARAIVSRPHILVLDDCTSALDAETEALLWNELYEFIPEMTVFLITHRVSTLQKVSKVILLEQGTVTDVGTHSELLERSAYYRSLYE